MEFYYQQFLEILRQYGRIVTFEKGGEVCRAQAYIAPFTHQNRQYLDEKYSVLGHSDQNAFRYLGSPEGAGARLAAGDLVRDGDALYSVAVCEPMLAGEKTVYIWAVLRRAGEEWTQ